MRVRSWNVAGVHCPTRWNGEWKRTAAYRIAQYIWYYSLVRGSLHDGSSDWASRLCDWMCVCAAVKVTGDWWYAKKQRVTTRIVWENCRQQSIEVKQTLWHVANSGWATTTKYCNIRNVPMGDDVRRQITRSALSSSSTTTTTAAAKKVVFFVLWQHFVFATFSFSLSLWVFCLNTEPKCNITLHWQTWCHIFRVVLIPCVHIVHSHIQQSTHNTSPHPKIERWKQQKITTFPNNTSPEVCCRRIYFVMPEKTLFYSTQCYFFVYILSLCMCGKRNLPKHNIFLSLRFFFYSFHYMNTHRQQKSDKISHKYLYNSLRIRCAFMSVVFARWWHRTVAAVMMMMMMCEVLCVFYDTKKTSLRYILHSIDNDGNRHNMWLRELPKLINITHMCLFFESTR